jgi:hypothetical protein
MDSLWMKLFDQRNSDKKIEPFGLYFGEAQRLVMPDRDKKIAHGSFRFGAVL